MSVSKASLLSEIREAVAKKKSETGERNAVVRVLAKHGAYSVPKIETGRFGKGATIRVYIWKTKWGSLVLSSGPSVEGEVQYADKRQVSDAPDGYYHMLEKATGTSKITSAMKKIAVRQEVTGSTTVSKPKRKKAAPKRKKAVAKMTAKTQRILDVYDRWGGREITKYDFYGTLQKEGVTPRQIVTALNKYRKEDAEHEGEDVIKLEVVKDRFRYLDQLAAPKRKKAAPKRKTSLTPILVEDQVDLIAVSSPPFYDLVVTDIGEENIYFTDKDNKRFYAKEGSYAYDVLAAKKEEDDARQRGKAQKDAEIAAETKAYSLVKDFKERGSTGFLKDVLKMYHGDDEYESRAARSEINDFAQYAVPGVRIQESMDVFANAAEGMLNNDKIVSYYLENRADLDQAKPHIRTLVEFEQNALASELDDAPDNRLLAMAEDAYLDDAVEDYYQAMKTRHGDEALFLGHTNDDPAGFERAIKTKLSQDNLESARTRSLGRRFYGLVKDREVSELFAELSGILDEEKLTNVNIEDAETHIARLNEIFGDANFQGNSVKGSMYGRLEAAEQRLAERKAEKEGAIAAEPETMSDADILAEMMQQLQVQIQARK